MHKLLAFYINGSLDKAEHQALEQALAQDTTLQAEADFLHALRRGIQARDLATPGDLGLKRLQRDLHRQQRTATGRAWRWATMAAGVLLILQTAMLIDRPTTPDLYAPLSGPQVAGNILQLSFVPAAHVADINAVLASIGARIIAGPGASGLYRIALPRHVDADKMVAKLKTRADIITYVARE